MAKVTVRYWAAARAAAGQDIETIDADTLGDAVRQISEGRPDLARLLGICSFLVDNTRADPATPLTEGAVVDALPPFAGG
jgi:molybdopterin converting factor small subunit